MTRVLSVLIIALALAGCNSSQRSSNSGADGSQESDNRTVGTAQATTNLPLTSEKIELDRKAGPDKSARANQLALNVKQLTEQANAAQRTFEFASAAKLWADTHDCLSELHGKDSWQAINARLAAETAVIQSNFDEAERLGLQELLSWQTEIAAFLEKSDYPSAVQQAERSMERTRELFGDDSYMMAKQWLQIARLRQLDAHLPEAVDAYREAILKHEKHIGTVHPDLETLHSYLGECFLNQGLYRPAVDNLKKSAWLASQLWGENSLDYAVRANDLGVAYQRAGEFELALSILRAAETIRREKLGPQDPMVAHSLLNIGTVYLELRRSELAVQCFEQSLPVLQQNLGLPNRIVVEGNLRYSAALVLAGRSSDAEKVLQFLVDKLAAANTPSTLLATAQYRLAILQAKQGRYETAEPALLAALANQRKLLGEDHPSTAKTKMALVRIFEQTDRTAEAAQLQTQIRQVNFENPDTQFSK